MNIQTYDKLTQMYEKGNIFPYLDLVLGLCVVASLALLYFLYLYLAGPKKKSIIIIKDESNMSEKAA